jgi:hypothetical protein
MNLMQDTKFYTHTRLNQQQLINQIVLVFSLLGGQGSTTGCSAIGWMDGLMDFSLYICRLET